VIEHHGDGTHTIHHIHSKHGFTHTVAARDGDVKSGVGDHDSLMDHMMDHTSEANDGEGHDEDNKPFPTPGRAPGAPTPEAE
jgi:hypothetical protein